VRAALAPKVLAIALAGTVATAGGLIAGLSRRGPMPAAAPHLAAPRPSLPTRAPLAVPPHPAASPPRRRVARVPVQGPFPHSAEAPGADLEAEARLIDEARALVHRGEVAGAFAVLARHARQFPAGTFREEREALRVLALGRAGRIEEAAAAAARFRSAFPRSVFVPIVNQVTSQGRPPGG
jgi:hypothetical protein